MKKSIKSIVLDAIFILFGSLAVAVGLAMFTVPNNIAPGGVSGISTALSYLTGLPVGALSLCLNIPIMIVAWRKLGFLPLVKTIIATVVLSVGVDIFIPLLPDYTNNPLLAALMGGVLMGGGMGVLLVRGISTGGTDLAGLIIYKKISALSMGQLLIVIDTVVIVFAVIVFQDIEVALYSLVTIVTSSKCIDIIQQGVDYAKVIYIITDREDTHIKMLAEQMGRGVTVIPAKGGFTGNDKSMLMLIARRNEVSLVLSAIKAVDDGAFIILSDATEVHGEGFKEYSGQ